MSHTSATRNPPPPIAYIKQIPQKKKFHSFPKKKKSNQPQPEPPTKTSHNSDGIVWAMGSNPSGSSENSAFQTNTYKFIHSFPFIWFFYCCSGSFLWYINTSRISMGSIFFFLCVCQPNVSIHFQKLDPPLGIDMYFIEGKSRQKNVTKTPATVGRQQLLLTLGNEW